MAESVSQREQLQYTTVINRGLILVFKEKRKFAILFIIICANSRILVTYANIRFKGIKLITWLSMQSKFFLNSNDFLDENASDLKLFWSVVKKLMGNVGRSCAMPSLLDTENDILYVDDIDKCNLLNSFFCSISKDWELQGPKSAPHQMSITFSPKCIFTICAFQK